MWEVYSTRIVWIALQTDTTKTNTRVKHAINDGLVNTQIFVYIEICMFLAFKWRIKDKNWLRIEGERNLFTKALFVSRYKPTLG